ncbi:MAG: hypothetical protein ACK4R6_01385 [Spirosomataceae bacterium]
MNIFIFGFSKFVAFGYAQATGKKATLRQQRKGLRSGNKEKGYAQATGKKATLRQQRKGLRSGNREKGYAQATE